MRSTRWSVALVLLEGNAKYAIGLISVVILARLLSPAEIGIFSIAYGFAAIGHIFRELGITAYVIQEPDLTEDRLRAAYLVSIVMAWTLGLLLAIASSPISDFYGLQGLRPVLLVLALNFLIVPFGALTLAVLRRELQFGRHTLVNLLSMLIGTLTTVLLAMQGEGAMSLAWGATTGLLTTVLLCALFRPKSVPTLPGTRELRHVLSFGIWTTGGSAVSQVGISGPDMIIGKVLGATDTGLFSKAWGVVDTFNRIVLQSLYTFSTPYFAARIRAGLDVREDYLYAVTLITGLGWPFFLLVALYAEPIIQLLLGPQWEAAAPVARLLCLSVAISVTFAPLPGLLIASGRPKLYSKYLALSAVLRVGAVISTAWMGLEAVAWSLAVAAGAAGLVALRILRRDWEISHRRLATILAPSFALGLAALLPAWLTWKTLATTSIGSAAWIGGLVTAGLTWLIAARTLSHPAWNETSRAFAALLERVKMR